MLAIDHATRRQVRRSDLPVVHAQLVSNIVLCVIALVVLAILLYRLIQREGDQWQTLLLVAQDGKVACRRACHVTPAVIR